jgi:DNA-binding NarL/FixJ family response regulator
MFGLNKKAVRPPDQHPTLSQLNAALPAFLSKFDLKALENTGRSSKPAHATLAKFEEGEFAYCLVRLLKIPENLLSPQQHLIACLVSQGLSNKEIADKISIKIGSVAAQLRHIYNKLRIKSRTELACLGISLE